MKNLRMLTKVFLLFVLFLAIPLVIAGFVFNRYMLQYSEDEISKSTITNLKTIESVDELFTNSIISEALSLNSVLLDVSEIKNYNALNENIEDIFKLNTVANSLEAIISSNSKLHSIYVYFDDANYVITSNDGVVPKDNFKDRNWIKTYNSRISKSNERIIINSRIIGRDDIQSTDPLPDITEDNKEIFRHNAISIILPISNMLFNRNGAIVINIYERELYTLINNKNFGNEGYIFIMDDSGTAVSYDNKQLLGKKITDKPYIKDIIDSHAETGYYINSEKGSKQMIVYFKSQLNNWDYVEVLPLNLINKTNMLRNRIVLLILGLLAFGSIISYIIAKKIYNPVKKLINDIQIRKGIDIKRSGDEMNILSKVFDSLTKQEENLFDTLEKNKKGLLDKYVIDILKGNTEQYTENLQFDCGFIYSNYICAIIMIDKYELFREKFPQDQQYYIKLMILKACQEVINTKFSANGVIYEKNKIAIIINTDIEDNEKISSELSECFLTLQKEVLKVLDNSISIGVGGRYSQICDISLSCMEAQDALKYRMITGLGSINFYFENSQDEYKYFYPYTLEKHINNFLSLGQKEGIIDSIQELINEVRNRKGISTDNILQVFIQLIGNTVKYLVDMNINVADIFGSEYNIYQKLASKETLDEIHKWLVGFYSGLIQYISNQGVENKSQIDKIIDYIHLNYKKNIDTTSIADNTGISYYSVGRIVKNKTGKNVLDYINSLRIEEAKRLLRQTNMFIIDIATNIGYNNDQSFNRFFKKYEGVTPGEFRNKI